MLRGLDHVVHAVRDLDAAAALYERLGFIVGARNRHPWGTHNRLIQLPGFFIELLTVAEPEKLGTDAFSTLFGTFNRIFLTTHEGFSVLLLESRDAARDAADFASAGIAASQAVRFEREGRRPDGSTATVGFSLAFARDAKASEAAFAVCQQHYPENFWNPAFQAHPNTASVLSGIVLVAPDPEEHRDFLSAFGGEQVPSAAAGGISITTARGKIQVMDPAAYAGHFGVEAPDTSRGARLAALSIGVREFSAAVSLLQVAQIPATLRMGRIVIGPKVAMGATLVLEQG
jgi:catechol 2,3-dioxygenase-like lactoylglutathione lyase family enzyme